MSEAFMKHVAEKLKLDNDRLTAKIERLQQLTAELTNVCFKAETERDAVLAEVERLRNKYTMLKDGYFHIKINKNMEERMDKCSEG
jgi:hypothetical protein